MKDRMEQVELGKKISLILEDKIGNYFHPKNQGAGVVLNLKIAVSNGNAKFAKAAKDFLKKEFSINLEEIRGHGAGTNEYTFIIKTAELSKESISKIELMYQNILLRKSGRKVVEPVSTLSENGKVESYVKKEKVAEKIAPNFAPRFVSATATKREMSESSKYRISLSHYLRPIMKMEGVIPNQFPFDQDLKDTKGGMITVRCQDEEIAIMVERSIAYTSKDLVVRDGLSLMIDGAKFYGIEHKPFAFPPKEGQTLEDVKEKIQSLCSSKLSILEEEGKFFISLSRKSAVEMTARIFQDLDWNLFSVYPANKSIILKYGYAEQKEQTAPSTPALVVKTAHSSSKSIVPSSDKGILKELKSLSAAGNLSPETMERIEKALLDDLKKTNPEEYAKMLLAKLGY